ncbi:Pycsar system effector family protein [Streptomyces solincola]|uniref:Pycsar system effector family protein n=1 Tax=Streptomyces solincola TaxID=2100817 RepID=UPI00215982F4|nr:Pycsar system effector family protein [Streptomyces solincola]
MLAVLLVVRPRLSGRRPGTFLHWAQCSDAELLADLTAPAGSQVQADRAEDLAHLSRMAKTKFGGLRASVDLTAAALVVLAAALLTTALH